VAKRPPPVKTNKLQLGILVVRTYLFRDELNSFAQPHPALVSLMLALPDWLQLFRHKRLFSCLDEAADQYAL
jgi:hypothetical protein